MEAAVGAVALNRVAENRIRDAMEQGEFDNLALAGEPLNLDEYFSTPEQFRMAHSILKNANCVPVEVELLNEVSRLEQAISSAADPAARQSLQRELTDRQTELAIALERSRRSK